MDQRESAKQLRRNMTDARVDKASPKPRGRTVSVAVAHADTPHLIRVAAIRNPGTMSRTAG